MGVGQTQLEEEEEAPGSLGENPDLAGAMNNLEQHLQARAAAEFPLPGAGEGGGDPEGEDAGCYIS